MKTLTLQKIPHIIIKSDSDSLEQERQEMLGESRELFEFPLSSSTEIEMVFQKSDRVNPIEIKYHLDREHLNSLALAENLHYFPFNLSELAIPDRETVTGNELAIRRKVRLMPVGNLVALHDRLEIAPLMSQFKPDRTFLIPLTRQINLLTANYKWKHLLDALVTTGGQLLIKIQKVIPSHFDINYALQCSNYYLHTYQGKLAPEEIDCHTKTYQAIISGSEVFSVRIYVKSAAPATLERAFLQDLDVNAFSLDRTELAQLDLACVDPEEKKFIKKLQLLWSLDEVLQLLTPPYTFRNALPGMPHFVPKPFLLPFMDDDAARTADSLLLGKLDDRRDIYLSLQQLQQHVFVTGSSGSGKTHTVHHLLHQLSGTIPVLIIDPAKREYEVLMRKLGKADRIIDFKNGNYPRFNPFIAPDNIPIYSHSSILAKTLAILFPTNEVAYELLLQMVRQTYIRKLCQYLQRTIKLKEFLNVNGAFLRQHPTCIPSFSEFLDIGIAWLKKQVGQNSRWGQEAVEHFQRRWAFLEGSLFKHMFTSQKPVDRYFESDYLIELGDVFDPNERNAIFAIFVAFLYEHRKSQGLQGNLTHLTVLEEAHQIIPAKQSGLGENMVSSPAYEASKLLADLLAEIRAYGEGIVIVDQSASKIIPDVLINSSTKIIHRVGYGADKQALSAALSLTAREMDYFSYLSTGTAIALLADAYQPVHLTIPKSPESV